MNTPGELTAADDDCCFSCPVRNVVAHLSGINRDNFSVKTASFLSKVADIRLYPSRVGYYVFALEKIII